MSAELSPNEWAVLAVLSEGATHGFAIARAMAADGEIGKVWSLRRPLVYHAIDSLVERRFARPSASVPSRSGPRRTVITTMPAGRRAVAAWLDAPVEHVRDARSLLLLKLLFLDRRKGDPTQLLMAQRTTFEALASRLTKTTNEADGFDQTLLRWRLESTTAALRFIDTIIAQ